MTYEETEKFIREVLVSNANRSSTDIMRRLFPPMQATDNGVAQPGHQTVSDVMRSVTLKKTGFTWSKKSIAERPGVNNDLLRCADLALAYYTRIDFMMYDGIRTMSEQASYVKAGTSKTMDSKHLKGLAVDLVPIIGGLPKWDWIGCYEIACAMDKAATELGIAHRITWGGCWDKTLDQYGGDPSAYAAAVESYKQRHPGPDFIDGPHFEIRP